MAGTQESQMQHLKSCMDQNNCKKKEHTKHIVGKNTSEQLYIQQQNLSKAICNLENNK